MKSSTKESTATILLTPAVLEEMNANSTKDHEIDFRASMTSSAYPILCVKKTIKLTTLIKCEIPLSMQKLPSPFVYHENCSHLK